MTANNKKIINHKDSANNLLLPPRNKYLPTSGDEINDLGWDQVDIILFSGDAYVDHPSFGAAVIGRVLQKAGYKVAIVPQPNWRDDLRDFQKTWQAAPFFRSFSRCYGFHGKPLHREQTPQT